MLNWTVMYPALVWEASYSMIFSTYLPSLIRSIAIVASHLRTGSPRQIIPDSIHLSFMINDFPVPGKWLLHKSAIIEMKAIEPIIWWLFTSQFLPVIEAAINMCCIGKMKLRMRYRIFIFIAMYMKCG